MEVKADDWGQNDHRDGGLEKFEPRYGSDELDVWEAVDQSVFVLGQVRVLGQRFYSRQGASVGSLQGGCRTWWTGLSPKRSLSSTEKQPFGTRQEG